MESPAYLFDQFAKMHGVTAAMAKRALMLRGFSDEGRTLEESARSLKIGWSTATLLCRRFIIDFSDYRPYAAREKKGLERPGPYRLADKPACTLPLFGAA